MLTLEKFERLSKGVITKKAVELQAIGKTGEYIPAWSIKLGHMSKFEQCRHMKAVLSELVVADIEDKTRFAILESLLPAIDRLVIQLQAEYITNPQSPPNDQKTYVGEVRGLYFLLLLSYQDIAVNAHRRLGHVSSQQTATWLKKITQALPANDKDGESRRLYILSVYRIMTFCYRLVMEYALTYQRTPKTIWRMLNDWYLKSSLLHLDEACVSKIHEIPPNTIKKQYLQNCLASFTNLFAYRRTDILQIFKILSEWVDLIKTTFVPDGRLNLFVNLQADTPPELITPYASINPYSNEYVCLFFEIGDLFAYLNALVEDSDSKEKAVFERRLAKMVLLAFGRQDAPRVTHSYSQAGEMVVGFPAIYQELSDGQSFNQIIAQSQLPEKYHPKHKYTKVACQKERVKLIGKDELGVRFTVEEFAQSDVNQNGDNQGDANNISHNIGHNINNQETRLLSRPYLPVFGVFAMKSLKSTNKHPWQLGIVHWSENKEKHVEIEGRFLGRLLSVCGVRLNGHDMRSKDFVQAVLVAGDGLNQQATLVLPRYHFKSGDMVILRVGQKQTALRLTQNLLSTDEIEQYEILRLAS